MKRYLIILTIVLLNMSAVCLARVEYYVPKAVSIPTIDGILSAGEWADALAVEMAYPDIVTAPKEGTDILGTAPSASDISSTWYLKWDEDALYIACDVNDDVQLFTRPYPGPYNDQDIMQLCLNLNDDPNAGFLEEAAIFDLAPDTNDSAGADIFRHDLAYDYDPNDIAATINSGQGYILEVVIPWTSVSSNFFAYPGQRHGFGMMMLDYDNGSDISLITDFGNGVNVIGDPNGWNTMVTVDGDCGRQGRSQSDISGDCHVNLDDFALLAADWLNSTNP